MNTDYEQVLEIVDSYSPSQLSRFISLYNNPCRWEQDMNGDWQTGCDNVFIIEAGGPEENGMKFCPYCGHHLEEMA